MRSNFFVIIILLLLALNLYGCKNVSEAIPVEDIPQVEESGGENGGAIEIESITVQADNTSKPEDEIYTDVAQGGPYGKISISLPAGWNYKLCPLDSDEPFGGMYGIRFYPENVDRGYIELAYFDPFGVCGTGLKSENATIAGSPVSIGTYDGHEYWDFIIFAGDYEGIVALTSSVEDWWGEYSGQVWDILNTLSFQPSEKEGGAYIYHAESEIETLGLSFSLKNISTTGATLVFSQYDPDAPTGELEFGDDFGLEVLSDGKWKEVPVAIEGNYGFNDIAYVIGSGECLEKELDWEWLYGELTAGEYRIKKVIHDFRETGDFDKYDAYAYFVLN